MPSASRSEASANELPGYDRVLKDMFLHDRPWLLGKITGGSRILEFLNVELPRTIERRADLVLRLSGRRIHHLELQSTNFAELPYRQGAGGFLLVRRFRGHRIGQTVLYVGEAKMRMPSSLHVGAVGVRYRLIDIREYDAREMMGTGRPVDLVLATLAGEGIRNLRHILERICTLPDEQRRRALAQAAILSGLRRAGNHFKMELNDMGLSVDIEKNVVLRPFLDKARDEGRAEGRAEGREQGLEQGKALVAEVLTKLLEDRFGKLPRWAAARLGHADAGQLKEWTRKVLSARTLEGVIGKR